MRISLFWRTFLLIGGLTVMSLMATTQLLRAFEHAPPEQQIAWEIASIVNLTRSALVSSEGPRRSLLLDELAREEDVHVRPLEPTDRVEPLPNPEDTVVLERYLQSMLGPVTRIAGRVNGEAGLWVSFDIDEDAYWLLMSLDRWTRRFGPPWWLVASLAIGVSLVGAIAISRLVNRPLASLARALGAIGAGTPTVPLPEHGPTEIAGLNQRFNRMASDLAKLDADRTLALAGISHDIRSPLTRLRMEIELSRLGDDEKVSMSADIERIDAIVAKFVEYARSGAAVDRATVKVGEVDAELSVTTIADEYRRRPELGTILLSTQLEPGLRWVGDPVDLARILRNLLENALRYGRRSDGTAVVEIVAKRSPVGLRLEVRDEGPGVPETELERLMRPFARLDQERSERGGSGLGLAIVQRLAQRYQGACMLQNRESGGLAVTVNLPDTRR